MTDVWRPPDDWSYALLLGFYLGDGCITSPGRTHQLRVSLDSAYPHVIDDCVMAMQLTLLPRRVYVRAQRSRCVVVEGSSQRWPEAFPQHGPGRRHERPIRLADWQQEIVDREPESFILGLIWSDGCRTVNRFDTKLPSGRVATYEYPRYFFSNLSADIRGLFCAACERLGIRWTQSNHRNISVSHRDSVATLDAFIGPSRDYAHRMVSQPRTRLGTDERRAQLLAHGLDLFSARSYDEISIDDIAAAAGVSKGLLYHYFPTKRDFYVAGLREAAAEITALTEPDMALAPPERLRQSLLAYLDYVENHAVGYRTLLRGGIGSDAEVRAILDETRAHTQARVLEGMGLERPDEAVRLALHGWMAFVEEASLEWLERREPPRQALVGVFIAVLTAAVDAAPAPGGPGWTRDASGGPRAGRRDPSTRGS